MDRPRRSRAFSLTEILFVLAIVAVLAAILLPVFASARRTAAKSTCMSNERQLGQAMILYGGDNEDRFPETEGVNPGGAWVHLTYAYAKSRGVYRCPADPTQVPSNCWWSAMPADPVSYGLNSNLPGVHLSRPGGSVIQRDTPTQAALASPSRTVMFFEVTDAIANPETTNTYESRPGPTPSRPTPDMPPLFVDGPTGNAASDPVRGAIVGGDEVQDWPNGQNAFGPEPRVTFATGPVGGRTLNLGKGSKARHAERANYLACDGHAVALMAQAVSGGADAVDASCDQGTVKGQTGACAAQRPVSAAGTAFSRYVLTFSAR